MRVRPSPPFNPEGRKAPAFVERGPNAKRSYPTAHDRPRILRDLDRVAGTDPARSRLGCGVRAGGIRLQPYFSASSSCRKLGRVLVLRAPSGARSAPAVNAQERYLGSSNGADLCEHGGVCCRGASSLQTGRRRIGDAASHARKARAATDLVRGRAWDAFQGRPGK